MTVDPLIVKNEAIQKPLEPTVQLDSSFRIRMLEESTELSKKISKLENFINNTETYLLLPWPDRHLLQSQLRAMQSYSRILQQRIKITTP